MPKEMEYFLHVVLLPVCSDLLRLLFDSCFRQALDIMQYKALYLFEFDLPFQQKHYILALHHLLFAIEEREMLCESYLHHKVDIHICEHYQIQVTFSMKDHYKTLKNSYLAFQDERP